jgi:hypothetical protein
MKNQIIKNCFCCLILCLLAIDFCYGDKAGFKKYESYIDKEQSVIKNKGISYDTDLSDFEYTKGKQNGSKAFTKKTTTIKKGNKEKIIVGKDVIIIYDFDKKVSYCYDRVSNKWSISKIEAHEENDTVNKTKANIRTYFKDITFIGYEQKFGYKCAVFKVIPQDEYAKFYSSNSKHHTYKRYIVDECGISIVDVIDNVEHSLLIKNIKVGIADSEFSLPKDAVVISEGQIFTENLKQESNKNNGKLTDTTNKTNSTTIETKEENSNISNEQQNLKTQIKEDVKSETKKTVQEETKKALKGFLGF